MMNTTGHSPATPNRMGAVRMSASYDTVTEVHTYHALIPELRGMGRTQEEAVTDLWRRLTTAAAWVQEGFHLGCVHQALADVRQVLDGA
jgi:hypothetical protein